MWIDLIMQMQVNKGLESISNKKYFSLLGQLNNSMLIVSQIQGYCEEVQAAKVQ